ncbi:MAG: DUF1858 domain-containing protein [Melioribacteraceae bacterium]
MTKSIITPYITIADLLTEYPELEDVLIGITPVFTKLKNPTLRNTIAKVTTLKQASVVGNVHIGGMIHKLRTSVGQNDSIMESIQPKGNPRTPSWVENFSVKYEYDATFDLNNGIHPIAKVTKDVETLANKESYILITPFIPAPLIDLLRNKGFSTHTFEKSVGVFWTYLAKV